MPEAQVVSLDKTLLDSSFLHSLKAVPSFLGIWTCFPVRLNFGFTTKEKAAELSPLWFRWERFA